VGIEVVDEPKPSTGGNLSDDDYRRYKYYDDLLGTLKGYANVSGGYVLQGAGAYQPGEYGLIDEVDPDVDYYSFDSYLYLEKDEDIKFYKLSAYLETLDTMRVKSVANGKPFWSYVSAGCDFRDDGNDAATGYYLTEADTLWNVNTSLAFGAKGIVYFPLIQPAYFSNDATSETGHDYERNGIIGDDGNTTRYYTMVQRANTQIAAVDDVLMNADSKGVIAVGNAASDITRSANHRSYNFKGVLSKTGGRYTDKLTNVTTSKTAGAMVGAFGYHSSEAYYVVNYDTTEDSTQTITLTFGNTQDITVIRNGVKTTYDSRSSLALTLDSGEGALVILEDYHDLVINAETGGYTLSDAATVNGVARAAAYEIKNCGVYDIQYVNGATYKVVIYKVGDIAVNGEVDICDLVRMKKYLAGITEIDKAGLNALLGLEKDTLEEQMRALTKMLLS
ncbi:MAG: hypothetical protein IK086_04565, partial [Clostridia bacterium]|nr:hypothetical protein [Clostridia bacterium]